MKSRYLIKKEMFMKEYVITSFMVLSLSMQLPLYAQQYLPIFEDGKRWVIKWQAVDIVEMQTYEILGDTIINGHSYCIFDGVLLREDDKVYMWDKNHKQDVILYDFDLKEGDTFYDIGEDRLKVVCVDTIEVGGIYRKRIAFTSEWYIDFFKDSYGNEYNGKDPHYWNVCWVEGIGSNNKPTNYTDWFVEGPRHTVQQCYFNDECIFTYDDFFTKSVSGITNPISLPSGKDAFIYDLQGRKVTTPQKNGLYIKNGKKFIAR